jgi:hypothetical protein
MSLKDYLLGSDPDDEISRKTKTLSDLQAKAEADLRNTLGVFMAQDQGMFFREWMENLAGSRVYIPGDTDLASTAFAEGARFIAQEILRVADLKGDK